MGGDAVRIAPLDLTLDKGAVSGNVRIQRDPADPLLLTGDFKFSGLDIESMISAAGAKEEENFVREGTLRAEQRLLARGFSGDRASNLAAARIFGTKPGNMTGPTRDGTGYRMTNTTTSCDTWAEVVYDLGGGKHGLKSGCNPFGPGGNAASLRVIVIPIIAGEFNGRTEVTITEFALFFLEGYGPGGCTGNNCEIMGRFINSNTNYGALTGVYDADTFAHFVRLVE
jgi:hypothetical protein